MKGGNHYETQKKQENGLKARYSNGILSLRTVSRARKAPHWFVIPFEQPRQFEQAVEQGMVVSDIHSFATLSFRNDSAGTRLLQIQFTWLQEEKPGQVKGWTERVRIPYIPFRTYMEAAVNLDDLSWKQLSIPTRVTRRVEFHSRKNLHNVIQHPVLRHKLGKFLEQHFQWENSKAIIVYDDFLPYSFVFQECLASGTGICGGIILNHTEDLRKAHYSIHT